MYGSLHLDCVNLQPCECPNMTRQPPESSSGYPERNTDGNILDHHLVHNYHSHNWYDTISLLCCCLTI